MKKTLSFFCFFLVCGFSSQAQIITTFAGNGTAGFSGDGGPATAASMTAPWGLARDAAGNIYFSDFTNKRVRKIDPAGIITTFAGNGGGYSGDGGPATAAGINGPTGIVIYGTDVYIAENFSSRVRKVNAAGIITTYAGNGVGGYSGDGGPATAASISTPDGLGVDNAGNIYIPDQATNHVRKVNTSGIITTFAGNGIAGYSGDGGPATLARISLPDEIVADAAGNVYFTDFNNNVIRKVNTAGIISTYAGTGVAGFSGDGGSATTAQLHGASGVHIDIAGNFYFGDSYNNRIRMINPSGIINTIAGNGTAGFSGDGGAPLLAEFNIPNLPCTDPGGDIYIGDMNNNRIRKITFPFTNTSPSFTGGTSRILILCQVLDTSAAIAIDSLLSINDPNAGQTETWSLLLAPVHGIAVAAYTAISTGSAIMPAGLSYAPVAGYAGNDSFKVTVTDGIAWDTITIYVTIKPLPDAGIIRGPSAVCIGDTIALADTSGGGMGVWSSSNTHATIIGAGLAKGMSTGADTIFYTVTNTCGIAYALRGIVINNCDKTGVKMLATTPVLHMFPNPAASVLNIEWADLPLVNATIIIRNVTGQKGYSVLMDNNTCNGTMQLNLSGLNEGIYLLTITSASFYYTEKLVINRR